MLEKAMVAILIVRLSHMRRWESNMAFGICNF